MDNKKAKNIWRNNFPKYLRRGLSIVGGTTFGKWTMPKQSALNITKEMQHELESNRNNIKNKELQNDKKGTTETDR